MEWTSYYTKLLDPEIIISGKTTKMLQRHLMIDSQPDAPEEFENFLLHCTGWKDKEQELFKRTLGYDPLNDSESQKVKQTIACMTPFVSVYGSWCQNLLSACVYEDKWHIAINSLFSDDMGGGCPNSSRFDSYRVILHQYGLHECSGDLCQLPSHFYAEHWIFYLPVMLLAMSKSSEIFWLELLGIDVALRTIGLPPSLAAVRDQSRVLSDWRPIDLGTANTSSLTESPQVMSMRIAAYYIEKSRCDGLDWEHRIMSGARWAYASTVATHNRLHHEINRSNGSHSGFLKIIKQRSAEASLYHRATLLGGCPMSGMFKAAAENPEQLLAHLKNSRFVKPESPQNSRLIYECVNPRGKMFRVFDNSELSCISKWIESLANDCGDIAAIDVAPPCGENFSTDVILIDDKPEKRAGRIESIRHAYWIMQKRSVDTTTKKFAIGYVRKWMKLAGRRSRGYSRRLPSEWNSRSLRDWLMREHSSSVENYEECEPDVPEEKELIEATIQQAPLLLIDGAWLEGFSDVTLAYDEAGALLFRIFWDELGNGNVELNHPKLFRDLLLQMGAVFGPGGSQEFCQDARFKDESFYLPVLWLCLGKLPTTFMPEILGLNLAIELSGVGDGYRVASKNLSAYGYDTIFVDLHNTIDNVGSGHSAWAVQAIEKYMNKAASMPDDKAEALTWTRIQTGFMALSVQPKDMRSIFRDSKLRGFFTSDEPSMNKDLTFHQN